MELNKESKDKAQKLANAMISNTKKDSVSLVTRDPVLDLRLKTAEFIEQRFSKIEQEDVMEKIVRDAIIMKIKSGDVTVSDLMTLLNRLQMRDQEKTNSLLQFFKPSSGDKSPLIDDVKEKHKEEFEDLSPEKLQSAQKMLQLLSFMDKYKSKNEDENEDDKNKKESLDDQLTI